MQLNIYVSKERAGLLKTLDEVVQRTGRQKNELVLDALEAYLEKPRATFKTHDLRVTGSLRRVDIYEENG